MSTLAELVSRTYREWLSPMDEQPARAVLDTPGGMSAGVASFIIDPTILSSEEENLLGEGAVVELENEQILVHAYDSGTFTITTTAAPNGRGYNGTEAISHLDGIPVYLSRYPSRQMVVDALSDSIVLLSADLYRVDTYEFVTIEGPVQIPADVKAPLHLRYQNGTRWETGSVEILDNFPHSATGVAAQCSWEVPAGTQAVLTYKASFARPADETAELTTPIDELPTSIALQPEYLPIIMARAVSALALRRDFDTTTVEFVTEALELQGFPVGSGERVARAIERYGLLLIDRAKREQKLANKPPPVQHRPLVYRW